MPSLDAAFVARAKHAPDAIAVTVDGRSITNDVLRRQRAGVARMLCAEGCGRGDVVAIALDGGADEIVAQLGVLAIGGVCLRLDVGDPRERLADRLTSVNAGLVFATRRAAAKLPAGYAVLHWDRVGAELQAMSMRLLEDPCVVTTGLDAAYIGYRCGEGGTRATIVTHASVSLGAAELRSVLDRVCTPDCGVAVPSFSELSPWSLWAVLGSGYRAAVLPHRVGKGTGNVLRSADHHQATAIVEAWSNELVSSFVEHRADPSRTTSVRSLLTFGDPPDPALLDQEYRGPISESDATLDVIVDTLETSANSVISVRSAAVGQRPSSGITGQRVYVLDDELEPVPVGLPGAFCVSGEGLARGFANRPGATATRFVANPFGAPGSRLYYSEIIGRRQPEGWFQPTRNARRSGVIEGWSGSFEEIARTIRLDPCVRDVAIEFETDAAGARELVAYVSSLPGEPSPRGLRERAMRSLPPYLVPDVVVSMTADLPRRTDGQIDRDAVARQSPKRTRRVAPSTSAEIALAAILSDSLGIDDVGAEDDFWAMGGTSEHAKLVAAAASTALGARCTEDDLTGAPTAAALADKLSTFACWQSRAAPGSPRVPLSIEQEIQWQPSSDAGGAPRQSWWGWRLRGALDVSALQAAVDVVINRHEILRTTFRRDEDACYQAILPAAAGLRVAAAVESELPEHLETLVAKPFQLAKEPAVRFHLLVLNAEEHVLLVVAHSLACDVASRELLGRELALAYRAVRRGFNMPPPAARYADYTLWRHYRLGTSSGSGGRRSRQLEFWRTTLADLPERHEWRPHHSHHSTTGEHVEGGTSLDRVTHARLEGVARANGQSLSAVLASAVAGLLTRLGAGDDVPVGLALDGRQESGLTGMIGPSESVVVLRMDLSGNPTWRQLLSRAGMREQSALSHRDVALANVSDALAMVRSTGQRELFQVGLRVREMAELDFGADVGVERLATERPAMIADVTIEMAVRRTSVGEPAGLGLRVCCRNDVLDSSAAQALIAQVGRMMRAMAERPHASLSSAEILDVQERSLLLEAWNATDAPLPQTSVVSAFEAWAADTPDAIAIEATGAYVSYNTLNVRANQLAHFLIARGVAREDVVGVMVERSVTQVVGLLGVLKAGAAYVPLDPSYPAARLAAMLENARPPVVLSNCAVPDVAAASSTIRVDLDSAAVTRALAGQHTFNPSEPSRAPDQHAAYVIYTSGSTGTPKGVPNTHQGLANRLDWMATLCGVTSHDRILQKTPASFDVSVWEFFLPLVRGARLVLLAPGEHRDPVSIAAAIRRGDVTMLHFVPAMLAAFVPHADNDTCSTVRHVICSGEALSTALALRLASALPRARIHNFYGPTEAAVDITAAEYEVPLDGEHVPIGRPVLNCRVYVLDRWLHPLPVGHVGELYLGGVQLARGYLRRPALTSTRFIASPFGPGDRLYRTGDLVYWNSAGELTFVGRTDHQFKIRGARVELGDVEAAVRTCLGRGGEVLVVAGADPGGGSRLIAYVVPFPGQCVDAAGLRAAIAREVPDFLVPAIVELPEWPLTPNGKTDRAALPSPASSFRVFDEPRTPIEALVGDLMADVLGISRVGRDESFFDLGGHSLLAMRLVARIRAALGRQISVRELFEAPTVARLTARLSSAPRGIQAMRGRSRPAVIPLSFAQQRLWFLQQLEAGPAYNLPIAVRLRGRLDRRALELAVADVVGRHEVLRTVFPNDGAQPRQRVLDADAARIEFAIDEIASPDHVSQTLAAHVTHVFDLETEIPIRTHLLCVAPDEAVLLIVTHHIASDGASLGVLISDVMTAYRARAAGVAPSWVPLPLQYADYAVAQRTEMEAGSDLNGVLARQLAYWRGALKGLPSQIALPTDSARAGEIHGAGAAVPLTIAPIVHQRLLVVARDTRASLFMIVHAALAAVLTRLGAGTDIPIGTPISSRSEPVLDAVVGLFVNTLVLRSDTSGSPTWRALIDRVRTAAVAAFEHADLPFERLVEAINPSRSLGRTPFFQVMLSMQERHTNQTWDFREIECKLEPVPLPGAKFDLLVSLGERRTTNGVAGGLFGTLQYRVALFGPATAVWLAAALADALAAIADDPGRRIDEWQIESRAEASPTSETGPPAATSQRRASSRELSSTILGGAVPLSPIALENRIADIWRTTLNLDAVGLNDNFFDLGGHSLLLVQVYNRLKPDVALPLSLIDLFRYPTIGTLAAYLTQAGDASGAFAPETFAATPPAGAPPRRRKRARRHEPIH